MLKKFSMTAIIRMILFAIIILLYYMSDFLSKKLMLNIMTLIIIIMFITAIIDIIKWSIKHKDKKNKRKLNAKIFFENLDDKDQD